MNVAGRTAVVAMLGALAAPAATPQVPGHVLTGLTGRVIANGRPVDWLVEVRLDSGSTGRTVATAYTIGSEEFEFQNILGVDPLDRFILAIDEDGYEPIRRVLDYRTLLPHPRNPFQLEFSGILVLHLEPVAPETPLDGRDGRSRVVDVDRLTASIPSRARDAYRSALEATEAGDAEAAVAHLEAALAEAPDFYDALNAVGIEYVKAGRYRDAENALERARELGPNDARPLINSGMLHFQEGQALDVETGPELAIESYRKAIGFLEAAVRLEPLAAEAHFYLGSALYENGDHARAEVPLLRALELDAGALDAHLALLNVYTRLGRYDDALGEIEAYLDAAPDSPRRNVLENVRLQIQAALEGQR